ncbi:hypothetical protein [Pelagibacterium xiamenense]|uniref:hypothetical protein n=1 Tax=Pelagibacterium xiamenense TaxID=2901140 RepID=UPI001E5851EA|nr:hypothetical protein [Pelagibacterium xiamenense]MCD7059604.1 hypothetical protein [Pelagibacterium xiamenense]
MSRVVLGMTAGTLLAISAGSAFAADWGAAPSEPVLRPAYPADWEQPDPLTFEIGLRYFYGMGRQSMSVGGLDHSVEDQSHFVELHGRIDDASTDSFLKGNLGFAAAIDGSYETPATLGTSVDTDSGTIAYAGADFGYTPFGNEAFRFGGLVGYQYLNESVDMGRAGFVTEGGGGDSSPNNLEIHALRLGVTAQTNINDMFDFTIDAAAIPFAHLSGTYGAMSVGSVGGQSQGSAVGIAGNLYGGSVEAMAGFHPTENLVIRAGARGYYLTGPVETSFEMRDADGENAQGYVADGNIELWRWGPVIELTGTF